MKIHITSKQFDIDMNNFIDYTVGFLEGVEKGKVALLRNLAKETVNLLKNFIDSEARLNPEMLHHVYEWYQTGSPAARLFNITSTVNNNSKVAFQYTLRQSQSVANGATTPFYNKAKIMESGTPIKITPKTSTGVLRFFDDAGNPVFSKGPVMVSNPGGVAVENGLEETIRLFFNNYFSQAGLANSGILDHLKNPIDYKKNLRKGVKGGRMVGIEVGQRWVSKDFGGIE